MTTATAHEAMSPEQAGLLAEFARACKAAVRATSLYPGAHPAIRSSLSRLETATARLTESGSVTLNVEPDVLVIGDRAPVRPDPAVGELATLLHERLIGTLRIEREADADDWRALLLLLTREANDLIVQGGIGSAWAGSGRSHFEIREIDYAEVLRERAGGNTAQWDAIIAFCLQGDSMRLDEGALAALLEAVGDPSQFGALLDRFQEAQPPGGTLGARAAALLRLLRAAVEAAGADGTDAREQALQTVAQSAARLTPEMMLAILGQRGSGEGTDAQLAMAVTERMTDPSIASFVAQSVVAERGATERLAHALEALVPQAERKERLLDLAHEEASRTPLGSENGFEELWHGAANMLMSYSDQSYVPDDYARELTGSRAQAIEVERVSDDPPDRIQGWLSTVSDEAVKHLDLCMLTDLLRIEEEAAKWEAVAAIVASEIERRVLLGDAAAAQQLTERIVAEAGAEGRPQLRRRAGLVIERLSSGPLVRHVSMHLRKVQDSDVEPLVRLCHTIGAGVVRPLAEALATEENNRAIHRLRELLLGFGAAGRQSVEKLKNSSNPAVRRTAIDLLRVFGGDQALPELASMLDDADPQVQRESVRAIVQIGSKEAFAVLQRALTSATSSRETVLQQLVGLRDDKTTPLLCYVLTHTEPRGSLTQVHLDIIEALGAAKSHPESTTTLREVLYRGNWWAPFRTASMRRAAALALRRIGSAEAVAVLREAATRGSRGVRNAARVFVDQSARRERGAA